MEKIMIMTLDSCGFNIEEVDSIDEIDVDCWQETSIDELEVIKEMIDEKIKEKSKREEK